MNLELGPGDLALLMATIGPDIDKQASWCLKAIRKALNRQPDMQLIHEFDNDFWPNYPRHIDKGHARTAYIRARGKVDQGTILRGLAAYSLSVRDREAKFICLAATWLNGERWTDELQSRPASEPAKPLADPYYAQRSLISHFIRTGRMLGNHIPPTDRNTLFPKCLLAEFASEFAAKHLRIPALEEQQPHSVQNGVALGYRPA